MNRKTLLFLSAAHCQACVWQNGELSGAEYFADNTEGHEQFTAFLQTRRDPVFLLTDLVEEDFRHETVPHLRGSERNELIQRKLEQYYRTTPFRQAKTLQRSKDGRRDDDMLFSALTNPALITPWLNIILALNNPLTGIYSLPGISAPLVKNTPSDCLLLLSWEKNAGLRQTYFDAKQLRFSRLTPINDRSAFGAAARAEASRTQQYLKNLSLLPPGHELNVTIICHANDRGDLEANLIDDSDMHYTYLDIQELGQRIGSKINYADSDATLLFLHLLATQPPHGHYAPAEHTHLLKLLRLRRSLLGISAAILTITLLWSFFNVREYLLLKDESQALESQSLQLSQQARQIIQNFPNSLASASDMKIAVILSRNLDNSFPPPQIMLEGLSKSLDIFPSIRIDKLSWQTSVAQEAADTASAVATQGGAAQIILLNGELMEFTGYRGALDHLERFRQALTQHGYSVTALTLPLDVSPQGSIAAETCDGSIKPAQFSLRILWRAKI
jgi:hypothetical protein